MGSHRYAHSHVAGARRKHVSQNVPHTEASIIALPAVDPQALAVFAELTDNAVVMTDPAGAVEWVNAGFTKITGYTLADVIGRQQSELLHGAETDPAIVDRMRTAIAAGQSFREEVLNYAKDGRKYWLAIEGQPIRDASGRLKHFVAIERDVTARRRDAEERARQSEVLFRDLVENINQGYYIADRRSLFRYCNPALSLVSGVREEELIGSSSFRLVAEPDRARIIASYREWARNPAVTSAVCEFRHETRSGQMIWVEQHTYFLRSPEGQVVEYRNSVRDITERKAAENALRSSEQRFADLFEFAPDAFVIVDSQGGIALANQKAEELFGWARHELVGQRIEALLASDSNDTIEEWRQSFMRAAQSQNTTHEHREFRARRRDGSNFPVDMRLSPLTTSGGVVVAASMRDLSTQREMERLLRRTQRLESIGTLAGGIAHDINNVLTPILTGVSVLHESVPPRDRPILDAMAASARRGADMVRQLLMFARGTEGEKITVHVKPLLRELEEFMRGTLPKNIRIRLELAQDLKPVTGDPTQLHQVLLNLCVNARDAMPDGGDLTISAAEAPSILKPGGAEARMIVIRVTDSGSGIAPEIIDHIFDPFFTTKEPGKGTGLGLATALGIIRGHGGHMQVESESNRGTTFSILLPATTGGTAHPLPPATTVSIPRGCREVVMIVDDDALLRQTLREALMRCGYEVVSAAGGAEALVLATRRQHELRAVIADLHMPGMDGVTLARALRTLVPEARLAIVSGRHEESTTRALKALGVAALIDKPYSLDKLVEIIAGRTAAKA